jgi:hypothetical protein
VYLTMMYILFACVSTILRHAWTMGPEKNQFRGHTALKPRRHTTTTFTNCLRWQDRYNHPTQLLRNHATMQTQSNHARPGAVMNCTEYLFLFLPASS